MRDVIATIFLSLAWLTGLVGHTVGRMLRHIRSRERFRAVGSHTELVAVAILPTVLEHRGWF